MDRARDDAPAVRLAPIAWGALACLGTLRMALQLYGTTVPGYGLMTDELYYLDSVDRLAWGFVDHPPLCVALLKAIHAVVGSSFVGLRFAVGLLGVAAMALAALVAREFGGGRSAQCLAAGFGVSMPVLVGMSSFYSMNVIDVVLTGAALWLVARIVNGRDPRHWWALGVVLGLGLLNKYSTLWFGFGLGVALVATPERRWLATPYPWHAGAIALLLFAPHLLWQFQHDFPTLEFLRNATEHKVVEQSIGDFLSGQLLAMNPMLAPLWIAGFAWLVAAKASARYRLFAWLFVAVAGVLAATGSARIYYLAPCFVIPIAATAVALEQWGRKRRYLPPLAAVAAIGATLLVLPFSVPLLPGERVREMFAAGGNEMPKDTESGSETMPMHLALQHHAQPTLAAFERALAKLPPAEREGAEILTDTFGSAAAVNVLASDTLPPAIGVHNHYWLWGPGDATGEVMLVLWGRERADLLGRAWAEVEELETIDCEDCADFLTQERAIYRCARPHAPLRELWPSLKFFM